MKRFSFLPLIVLTVALASCTSQRYCADTFKSDVPTDIPLLLPYVDIFSVSNGQETYSDSLSTAASDVITGILNDNVSQYPFSDFLRIDDDELDRRIGREGAALAFAPKMSTSQGVKVNAKRVCDYQLPESIRQLMEDNDLPYLMLMYEDGFKRVKGDVLKETVKDAAVSLGVAALIAVLSLGTVVSVPTISSPNPYATSFTLLVADRANNSIAYYNTVEEIYDPLSRSEMYSLLNRLFKKYPGR